MLGHSLISLQNSFADLFSYNCPQQIGLTFMLTLIYSATIFRVPWIWKKSLMTHNVRSYNAC